MTVDEILGEFDAAELGELRVALDGPYGRVVVLRVVEANAVGALGAELRARSDDDRGLEAERAHEGTIAC